MLFGFVCVCFCLRHSFIPIATRLSRNSAQMVSISISVYHEDSTMRPDCGTPQTEVANYPLNFVKNIVDMEVKQKIFNELHQSR